MDNQAPSGSFNLNNPQIPVPPTSPPQAPGNGVPGSQVSAATQLNITPPTTTPTPVAVNFNNNLPPQNIAQSAQPSIQPAMPIQQPVPRVVVPTYQPPQPPITTTSPEKHLENALNNLENNENQNSSAKKKKIIIVTVASLTILVGGYLIYKTFFTNAPTENTNSTPTTEQANTEAPADSQDLNAPTTTTNTEISPERAELNQVLNELDQNINGTPTEDTPPSLSIEPENTAETELNIVEETPTTSLEPETTTETKPVIRIPR